MEKEVQKDYKRFLQELKEMREELVKTKDNDSDINNSQSNKATQKKLGTLNGINVYDTEDNQSKLGYANAFLLAFLSFFFETLFILISLLIYK